MTQRNNIGAFNSSRYSLLSYHPVIFEGETNKTLGMIRINRWAKENNYSRKQVLLMIQTKKLLAKKFKGDWYIKPCENFYDFF
jgi:hypothetical protein